MSQCQKVSSTLWHGATVAVVQAMQVRVLCSFPPRPSPLQCPACPVVPRALLPVALVPCLALPCPALSLGFVQAVVWLVPHQCLIAWPHCLYGWLFFFLPLPPENVELFIEGVFFSIPLELCRISHSSPIPAPRHVLAGQKICSCKYFFQRHS